MRDGNGPEAIRTDVVSRQAMSAIRSLDRDMLVEERRGLLQQLRGYEQVATGLRMRVAQIERMMEDEPNRS